MRVADDLIKAGVADDQAWYLAKKYVIGSTMDDRIAGLLSEPVCLTPPPVPASSRTSSPVVCAACAHRHRSGLPP